MRTHYHDEYRSGGKTMLALMAIAVLALIVGGLRNQELRQAMVIVLCVLFVLAGVLALILVMGGGKLSRAEQRPLNPTFPGRGPVNR